MGDGAVGCAGRADGGGVVVFLGGVFISLHSSSSSTVTMFANSARIPFVCDSLLSRQRPHDRARTVLRHVVVNFQKT